MISTTVSTNTDANLTRLSFPVVVATTAISSVRVRLQTKGRECLMEIKMGNNGNKDEMVGRYFSLTFDDYSC
jgi:hypothetical protein